MAEPELGVAQGGFGRHGVLNALVKCLQRPRVTVLEVGSYEGQSALIWSAAIAEHCPAGGSVLCVDPWSPLYLKDLLRFGAAYVRMEEALRDGSAYQRFCRNAALADPRVPISHLRGSLNEVYEQLSGRTFDIVYVDGDHRASAVRSDLEMARALVSVGGILCGDDLELQGGDCDLPAAMAIAETKDYVGYHPGVTVAVWETFGRVWERNGAWAVQKVSDQVWLPPGGVT
jgi:hypothetical protein